MSNKIDIVIPWLNPNEKWYKEYKKYSKNEHPGRVRDLGTFKYVLRSIERNVPWVNKIFIILYDETQIPEWLNTENEKIKIIFHKDILPEERLPNFSSVQVDMRLSFIEELSNSFIFMNDDMLFLNKTKSTDFFVNGKPVHIPSMKKVQKYNVVNAQWGKIELNNYNFVNKLANAKLHFWTGHAPIPFNKVFQQFLWKKFKQEFDLALTGAHIRADNNMCNWVFYNLEEFYKQTENIKSEKLPTRKYFALKDSTSFKELNNCLNSYDIVCINDGDAVNKNFEKIKSIVKECLNTRFPDKSNFEK